MSLVVSYGRGLFGSLEAEFRAPLACAVVTETGAVILLTSALAGVAVAQGRRTRSGRMSTADERTDDSRSAMTLPLRAKAKSA